MTFVGGPVVIPTKWTAVGREGAAVVRSPKGDVTTYSCSPDRTCKRSSLGRGSRSVRDLIRKPTQVQTPLEPGVTQTVATDSEGDERVYQRFPCQQTYPSSALLSKRDCVPDERKTHSYS